MNIVGTSARLIALDDLLTIGLDKDEWTYHRPSDLYAVEVGDLHLQVFRNPKAGNATWLVSHTRFGMLIQGQVADSVHAGKRASIEWCQQWLEEQSKSN